MQFSEQWLRQWVDPNVTSDQLVEALTMLGLEVDSVTPVAGDFSGVVVGHVISREQHPNADRLSFCRVDVGDAEPVEVVCGAPNVREGLKVAFVKVGGVLPGDFKIKKAKLRGVESFGMICSSKELGLGDDHDGIIELPEDAPVGQDIRDYLNLNDQIIDIELTPNRGDCTSIAGVARDIGAQFKLPLSAPSIDPVAATIDDTFPIKVEASAENPRYVGRVIRHVNASVKTPMWLKETLRRCGLRSIHPIVDISNYVMLELGQPMHAFDLDKLAGGITVRFAKKDEAITLLDEQSVKLTEKMLVIADERRAHAVAGVMGGFDSSVTEATQTIFVESAYFEPTAVTQSSRALNLTTDSSYRFERGVDHQLQQKAVERFTQLVLEICGGQAGPITESSSDQHLPAEENLTLRHAQISRLLGIQLSSSDVESILTGLGMSVETVEGGWSVGVPSYRSDIMLEVDLIEELLRLYGLQNVPSTTMLGELKIPAKNKPYLQLQRYLNHLGYHEAVTYSFVDPDIQRLFDPEGEFLELANPLSQDISVMRTSLLPGLVQALHYNLNRQVHRLRLFETGLCFIQEAEELKQVSRVAGLIAGSAHQPQWGQSERAFDFYDLKGDVEKLLVRAIDGTVEWRRSSHSALHPGQSADLYWQGLCLGSVGALHPSIVSSLGLSVSPYVFELDLIKLDTNLTPRYDLISKFPAVRRDLAIVIDEHISANEIEECVKEFAGPLLLELRIFDIYHGEAIEFGKKSVAMGLTFQDSSRTLVEDEISEIMGRVVQGLEHKLQAILRA